MKLLLLLLLAAVMAACATPPSSVEECRKANWRGRGEAAGAEGQQRDVVFNAQSTKCVQLGVAADKDAFDAGWANGRARYCTPRNALAVGRKVENYTGICAGPGEATILKAHDQGRLLSEVDREISRIESDLRGAENAAKDGKLSELERNNAQQRAQSLQFLRQTALSRRDALEQQAIGQGWGLGR